MPFSGFRYSDLTPELQLAHGTKLPPLTQGRSDPAKWVWLASEVLLREEERSAGVYPSTIRVGVPSGVGREDRLTSLQRRLLLGCECGR